MNNNEEVEITAGASIPNGPYHGGEEIDELEAEPESPLSPLILKRKHIAAHLGLTEAQQDDVMHMHRALQMGPARVASDRMMLEKPQIKPSLYDYHSVLQQPPVDEIVDECLVRKGSSSRLSNFLRYANKPLVFLQQPMPAKIARMRSLRKAFSSDTFRTTFAGPKTLENIGLVPMPGPFPTTGPEQFGLHQTTHGADFAVGESMTNEPHSVVGEVAGLVLDDEGETCHDAESIQGEHRDSGISDEARPLL